MAPYSSSSHRRMAVLFAFGVLLVPCAPSSLAAGLSLRGPIGDNMVLQHGQPLPVWGLADPGETVSVEIAGRAATSKADADGRWQVTLPELAPSSDPLTLHVRDSSGSQISARGVLVGEVWFATGPSNIFWPVSRCDNSKEEIEAADYPQIRFFTVPRNATDTPQADCKGSWFTCTPQTVGDVSGVAYFFARRLHNDLDMPVGILQSFWGGSRIEAWTSLEALQAQSELKPILDWWTASNAEFDSDKTQAEYKEQLAQWRLAAAEAETRGEKPPARPKPPGNPRLSPHRPACLYNGMVAPLIPYGIRGVISYQGLGNLFWAQHSRLLLETMIGDWRSRWGQGPFPFGMVQPAPYPCDQWPRSGPDAYSLQREAQLLVLDTTPNTGVAPTTDVGDLEVLHFTNKQEVGRRMALWALATVYGRDVPYSGPVYQSMTVEGPKIRIRFTHTGTGLTTRDGRPPSDFTIAGADQVFQPAIAEIDGRTLLVHSDAVPRPTAVRFAFNDVAIPNLINREGLPASLFRTDGPRVADTSRR